MSDSSPGTLLAVYGTLKRGCANHDLLLAEGCQYQRDCLIPGRLYDLDAYPGLKLPESIQDEPTDGVHGELYQCPPEAFPAIDRLEGATGDQPLFERNECRLVEPEVDAWVYEYARAVSESARITDGEWPP